MAKGWEDARPQANLAHSAADQLSEAALPQEAVTAYERALELYRVTGGAPVAEVRILRSLAWLGLREEVTDALVAQARARMAEAAEVLEAALAAEPQDPALRSELARTWHQLAQVLDRRVTTSEPDAAQAEALRLEEIELVERAAALYAELGPDHLEDRLQCVQFAAWTEQELGRDEAGAARMSALIEELRALPEGAAGYLLERAEYTLGHLTS